MAHRMPDDMIDARRQMPRRQVISGPSILTGAPLTLRPSLSSSSAPLKAAPALRKNASTICSGEVDFGAPGREWISADWAWAKAGAARSGSRQRASIIRFIATPSHCFSFGVSAQDHKPSRANDPSALSRQAQRRQAKAIQPAIKAKPAKRRDKAKRCVRRSRPADKASRKKEECRPGTASPPAARAAFRGAAHGKRRQPDRQGMIHVIARPGLEHRRRIWAPSACPGHGRRRRRTSPPGRP